MWIQVCYEMVFIDTEEREVHVPVSKHLGFWGV